MQDLLLALKRIASGRFGERYFIVSYSMNNGRIQSDGNLWLRRNEYPSNDWLRATAVEVLIKNAEGSSIAHLVSDLEPSTIVVQNIMEVSESDYNSFCKKEEV